VDLYNRGIEPRHYARPAPLPKEMGDFIRLYAQIALLRRGPQDLPASPLLLALTVAAFLAVNFVVSSLLWYVVLLRLAGRPERTLQTTSAVFGFQTVLAPLVIGCGWLARRFTPDSPWQVPIMCAVLLLFAWVIAANSYIVRAALEWSVTSSVVLVILQAVAGGLLLAALFPPIRA